MTAPTLADAITHAYRTRWTFARNDGKTLVSQATRAADDLAVLITEDDDATAADIRVEHVTPRHVQQVTSQWYGEGLAPATINKRLNCLGVLGVKVQGVRVKEPVKLKWWLRPEEEERAIFWLTNTVDRATGARGSDQCWVQDQILADFIMWTTRTGLRIEESLRLVYTMDFAADYSTVTVPGLKTAVSQATLPLGIGPRGIVARRYAQLKPAGVASVFPIEYRQLQGRWANLAAKMGWDADTATLKALRRSAARYLHVDCGMPIDMVRHYLRHENIETTMGYLRLTGGYGTEEMRRFLK